MPYRHSKGGGGLLYCFMMLATLQWLHSKHCSSSPRFFVHARGSQPNKTALMEEFRAIKVYGEHSLKSAGSFNRPSQGTVSITTVLVQA